MRVLGVEVDFCSVGVVSMRVSAVTLRRGTRLWCASHWLLRVSVLSGLVPALQGQVVGELLVR